MPMREIVTVYMCTGCQENVRALALPGTDEPTVYGPCKCVGFRAAEMPIKLDVLLEGGFVEVSAAGAPVADPPPAARAPQCYACGHDKHAPRMCTGSVEAVTTAEVGKPRPCQCDHPVGRS